MALSTTTSHVELQQSTPTSSIGVLSRFEHLTGKHFCGKCRSSPLLAPTEPLLAYPYRDYLCRSSTAQPTYMSTQHSCSNYMCATHSRPLLVFPSKVSHFTSISDIVFFLCWTLFFQFNVLRYSIFIHFYLSFLGLKNYTVKLRLHGSRVI